ncbi:MAG: hypothetical protein J1F36_02860 [Clostridiales bacterium]|nr:hypothetical protein [Clostridiales bacterium]
MKKIKSIWMRLLVIVISVAMMIGCLGGIVLADGETTTVNGAFLHVNDYIPSKIELGQSFAVPAAKTGVDVIVKGPSGELVNPSATDGKYVASNLGNYTVTYSDGNVSYTYTINCYEDAEYFIYVENNGATIPSYIEQGKNFTLPEWYLAKYDDEGNIEQVTENVKLEWSLNGKVNDTGVNVAINELGSQILVLSAKFTGSSKTYKEEYTVISQTSFEDTKAPTINNIANMPSSASINTKVSLPKATASDDYDENVLIKVSVKDPDGNDVKEVELNDNDFAIAEKANAVAFDNDRVTSFYPRKNGTYVVSYVATDDAGNTSSEHSYKITVSDKTGPVITDIEDDKIPTVWGLTSVSNADEKEVEDLTIKIPVPEVVDNLDVFNLDTESDAWTGKVKMTVEIKNPDVTVARWTSLTPADFKDGLTIDSSDATYGKYFATTDAKGNPVKGVQIVTNEGGRPYIRLNFGDFYADATNDTKTKAGITGNWTITFSFRDDANNGGYNNSQKVYTINVSDSVFVDEKAPEIEAPALPDYLIIGNGEETYTVPSIVVSDDKDSRLTEDYKLKVGENTLAVKSGEELNIVEENGKYYFENEDGERLELIDGGKIEYVYSATDDAGNTSSLKTKNDADEDVNYSLNVYIASGAVKSDDIEGSIDFSALATETIKAGSSEVQRIGGFVVKNITQREFVGFELSIKDEEGNSLDGVSSFVFFAEEDGVENLYVKNIQFNPAKGGDYEINVRVLDAKGSSILYAKKVTAEAVPGTSEVGPNAAATSWDSVGTARKSYTLQRKTFTVKEEGDYTRVYKIYGGKFSLLGYEFTPIAQGGFTITEYYDLTSKVIANNGEAFETSLTKNAVYGMTVTDENSTNYEVEFPSYYKGNKTPDNSNKYQGELDEYYYITSAIVAYSENQNYDVTVTYTDPKGDTHTAKKVYENEAKSGSERYSFKEDEGYEFFGRFALILDKDGTYTITVKANDSNTSVGKDYKIKVGDIEAPQFKLNTAATRATVGDKFAYRTISDVVMGANESDSDITVTYRLLDPSNTEISAVSGTGTLTNYNSKIKNGEFTLDNEYKFEKSGDYTVEITLKDAAGNKSVQKYTITVSTATSKTPRSLTMLSTILIIVGVLLILGVLVYLIRFRKRRAE